MSYSLNSFKGVMWGGLYRGSILGVIKRETRSLDYSSHIPINPQYPCHFACSFPIGSSFLEFYIPKP